MASYRFVFCDWFISLSIISTRVFHVVTYDRISFVPKAGYYPIACIHHIFFIHPSSDGYLGCLLLLAMANDAVMNMEVQTSVHNLIFSSFGYILRSAFYNELFHSLVNPIYMP